MEKKILDMTCGSRSIWFNKNHPAAVYCDKREEAFELAFGRAKTNVRKMEVKPDVVCDFTDLPFEDNTFSLVVFDPPPPYSRKRYGMACQEVRQARRELAANASRRVPGGHACA